MRLQLLPLDCAACGSALRAEPHDIVFICDHCGAGAVLDERGLTKVESTALMPAPGRHANRWRPAWILETDVRVDNRIDAKGRRTPGGHFEHRFVIPAFPLPLSELAKLCRALSQAAGSVGEVPREPITGAARNWASAKDIVIRPRPSTPEPSSPRRRAKTGMMMPKPVIINPTLNASSSTIVRVRRRS